MALNDDLNESVNSAQTLSEYFNSLNKDAKSSEALFGDISTHLKESAKYSQELTGEFQASQKSVNAVKNLSKDLSKINKEDLETQKGRNSISKKIGQLARERKNIETQLVNIGKSKSKATGEELANLINLEATLNESVMVAGELENSFQKTSNVIDSINKKTNFVQKLADGVKDIPGIGPLLAGPLDNLAKGIAQFQLGVGKGVKGMEAFKNVTDAVGKGSMLFIVKSLFDSDKATTNLAKQLGISKANARGLKLEFNTIAIDSGKAYLTSSKMVEAQMELGNAIGAVSGFTKEQITTQVTLTKMVGLQGDEAANLAKYGTLNNKSSKELSSEILDQVVNLQKQTGIQLDGRKVLKEVASINGALGAQYGFNTKEIANAVIQANMLGLSLKETAAISQSLLDFETSISNELEAELLVGKSLNFEKARALALDGKTAEAAADIASQMGSSADFLKLNVIQREALAKAAGMTSDQLSDSIKSQEVLNKLGASSIQEALELEGGRERILAAGGAELLQQYEQQSAADKFSDAMFKIKDAIGTIAEGPIGNLIDGFADMASSSGVIYTAMAALGTMSMVKLLTSLYSMAVTLGMSAAAAMTTAAAITLGVGIVAVIAGLAAMSSASDKTSTKMASKATSVGDGAFGSDGKTQISTKEGGLFEISPNDDVVVAPGAIDQMNKKTTIQEGGSNQSGVISELKIQNGILMRILQKSTNIEIDGTILNKKIQQSTSTIG